MAVLKVVELIGTSDRSFDDALKQLAKRACRTVRGITGIHIVDQKVHCDGKGNIVEYRVVCKMAFKVE
ncbi:Dodecin [uncultured archaeon]|nr:Dodecin [uncultured archaeon]